MPTWTMDKVSRTIIQTADKYVRRKEYRCLFPGCGKRAIRSHAIPRALCIEALAENGVVYSQRQSFSPTINMEGPDEPPEVVAVGINQASTFNGYCSEHDMQLFASAETADSNRKNGMFIALHLRALSLEYDRKRRNADYFRKVAELDDRPSLKSMWQDLTERYDTLAFAFREVFLASLFNLIGGSNIDAIEYFCVPFARNLGVSCCGCFNERPEALDSMISYNLISYPDMTMLVLTIFKTRQDCLDSFLAGYSVPNRIELLVNDIAFAKCEEPLISAKLWHSLDETQKFEVRLSLRHPDYQARSHAPTILKLESDDLVKELTPELLARLPTGIATRA